MGGIFGVASKENCVTDLFFGVDYHSHLGTKRGGMAVYSKENAFKRAIHNIENTPFRTKFEDDLPTMEGNFGIGCISDTDSQPLIVRSSFGSFAVTTVGKINNSDEILEEIFSAGKSHFMEQSGGYINTTEIVAGLISSKDTLIEGIQYAQERIEGSMSMMTLDKDGIHVVRDKFGRTPILIGKKDNGYCASFESFAYKKLDYKDNYELGAGEIIHMSADGYTTIQKPFAKKRVCAFLWVYYGYPTSSYEGVNVECMRNICGESLANVDKKHGLPTVDYVAGVPDSGVAHAIGYANKSGIPFARPLIKYTPTWPRSFMPTTQNVRNMVAKMKLISVDELIKDKSLLFIEDSIVRGTQMKETVDFLYEAGAKEVHVRSACPPIMYGCKYLNFSRSNSEMDLITRQVIAEVEGEDSAMDKDRLAVYANQDTKEHKNMVDRICKKMNFTSLGYNELNEMLESININKDDICTYCWNGVE